MVYMTIKRPPMYRQISLEELLFSSEDITSENTEIIFDETSTKTYEMKTVREDFVKAANIPHLVRVLKEFNEKTNSLREFDRENLYDTFYIPKRSGGLRRIDAPNGELMQALRDLKTIFETDFKALYHTASFAYIKKRSTLDAVKRHQKNESKWFGKYDLHNFFGSTTEDFVTKMFSMVFPFSEVMKSEEGNKELRKAIELAFLNGGLPQGTPVSPVITNIMMIPIDFSLARSLRDFNKQRFVYTRYADDFLISSRYNFSFREVEDLIKTTLSSFEAPFELNTKKTRYGSSAGSNWNLGLMLNKDNKITVGYKKKKQFQAMVASYVMDRKNGKKWSKNDIQVMDGYRAYYTMIEGENIDLIISHIGNKFGVDVRAMIKEDLSE